MKEKQTKRFNRKQYGRHSSRPDRERIAATAQLETLETRQLMSAVTLEHGVLTLTGDADKANELIVNLSGDNTRIIAKANGQVRSFPTGQVSSIHIVGGEQSDFISVNRSLHLPSVIEAGEGNNTIRGGAGPDTIYAGRGEDTIQARGGHNIVYDQDANGSYLVAPVGIEAPVFGPSPVFIPGPGHNTSDRNVTPPAETPVTVPATVQTPAVQTPTVPTPTVEVPGLETATGTLHPVITVMSATVPSGTAVHVNALSSPLGANSLLDVSFQWNFGDNAGAAYNDLSGFNAAHVYDQPGTYAITVTMRDASGHVGQAQTIVSIVPAALKSIYIAANGNDANSGLTPTAPVRSIARAQGLMGDNTQLLFNTGQSYALDRTLDLPYSNVRVGSYGTGTTPRLNWDPANGDWIIGLSNRSTNITIENLSFDTPSRARDTEERGMPFVVGASGRNITVRNNEFLNVGYGVQGNGVPTGLLVQGNSAPLATGLRGYLVWGEGSDLVILGNSAANSTREHIVRMTRTSRVLIANNNFTNADRSSVDAGDYSKSTLAIHDNQYVWVTGNQLTGGPVRTGPLAPAGAANYVDHGVLTRNLRTDTVVVENNRLNETWFEVKHGASNIAIRNNLVTNHNKQAFQVDGYDQDYQREPANILILNNTVRDDGNEGLFMRVSGHSNGAITLANNLYVAPNLVTGASGWAMFVMDSDLSSFRQISDNVWPVAQPIAWAEGGYFYVWPGWSDARGSLTPQEWTAQQQVRGEQFLNVTLQNGYQVAVNGVTAGARLAA